MFRGCGIGYSRKWCASCRHIGRGEAINDRSLCKRKPRPEINTPPPLTNSDSEFCSPGLSWGLLGSPGPPWAPPGLFWALLGSPKLSWARFSYWAETISCIAQKQFIEFINYCGLSQIIIYCIADCGASLRCVDFRGVSVLFSYHFPLAGWFARVLAGLLTCWPC